MHMHMYVYVTYFFAEAPDKANSPRYRAFAAKAALAKAKTGIYLLEWPGYKNICPKNRPPEWLY